MLARRTSRSMTVFLILILLFVTCSRVDVLSQTRGRTTAPSQTSQLTQEEAMAEVTRLNKQAGELYAQGKYDAAIPLAKSALQISEQALSGNLQLVANMSDNLAVLYFLKGDYASARPLVERAVNLFEKVYGTVPGPLTVALGRLATIYMLTDDFEPAEQTTQRIITITRKGFGPEHPDVAAGFQSLCMLNWIKGDYERAKGFCQRALAIYEKAVGPKHLLYSFPLTILGAIYFTLGDFIHAEEALQPAFEITESVLGPDDNITAMMLGNLAMLQVAKGEYERAEQLLRRALIIYANSPIAAPQPTTAALQNLSMIYFRRGDYVEAERLLQRALKVIESTFGPRHQMLRGTLNTMAFVKLAQGAKDSAFQLLSRYEEISEYGISQITAPGSERQKRLYMATLAVETNVILSTHIIHAPTDPRAARIALTTILHRKGRALDLMTDQIAALRRRLGPRDITLLDQLATAKKRISVLALKISGQGGDGSEQRVEMTRLEDEIERLERAIAARSAEFRLQAQPVTIGRVQLAIPSDAALVELVVYKPFNAKHWLTAEQFGEPRYAAYLLRHEGEPTFVDLGEAAPIDQAVLRFRAALADPKSTDVKQIARALDELVMRPVRKLLGETRMVLLSPDGQLNLVPFAALVDEQGRYLVENYTFTYLTSGRDLLRLDAQAQGRQQPVVLANPAFDFAVTTDGRNVTGADEATGRRSLDFKTLRNISPLPGTAQEAAAIKSIVPSAQVLTERAATEAALKRVAGPRFLHIATHGFFLKDQPIQPADLSRRISMPDAPQAVQGENPLLRSGLVLAGVSKGQSGAGEDGVLTALEVAGLDLWGTKLVVLSACDTAVGDTSNGEGVYGLRRALVLAGAESQLMSLWQVSDTATRDLMIDYYRRLENGEGRTVALRAAQIGMLASNREGGRVAERRIGAASSNGSNYSHPYYWASFIPIGDWRSINKPNQRLSEAPQQPATLTPQSPSRTKPSDAPRPAPRTSAPQIPVARNPAEHDPHSFEAQMRAAATFRQLGNLGEAMLSLQRALALRPNDVSALTAMGNAKYDTGDFIGAASFYKRSLALRPDDADVRGDLGNAYFYQASTDYDAAIAEYRRALVTSPRNEKLWHNLAVVALRKKSELIARDAISQLAEINPANSRLESLRSALAALGVAGKKQASQSEALKVVAMHN